MCLRSREGNDRLAAEGPGLSGRIGKEDGSFGSCLVRGKTSGKASTPRPREKAELENGLPCQYPGLLVLPWKSVQLHRQGTLSETRLGPWGSCRVSGIGGMGFPSFLKLLPAPVAGHVGLSSPGFLDNEAIHPSCIRSMYTHRSLAMGSNFKPCSFLYPLGFGYLDHGEALCCVLSSHGSWALVRMWDAFPLCLL